MIIKRGDNNNFVKILQEWLSLSGHNVDIDGAFGPATEAAVKRFQLACGIMKQDGIVDQETMDRLSLPLKRATTNTKPRLAVNETVVEVAHQHLIEHPREKGGDNMGPWVRLYTKGFEGRQWAWCAGFVCTIIEQAFKAHHSPAPFKHTVSCDDIANWNKEKLMRPKNGMEARSKGLKAGAIFLNRKTETDWVHTGIVTGFKDDHFETIEGNTNDEGSREGYEVCARLRSYNKKDFVPI